MGKKTLIIILSSVVIVACNNTGEQTPGDNIAVNSAQTLTSVPVSSDFTFLTDSADGVESKIQNYGQQWVESIDNYPGVRFNAAFDHVENKYGSFTVMYGGCNGTQESDLLANPSLSPKTGNCYNDVWLYNHDTHNWVWIDGLKGVLNKDSVKWQSTYAFAPSKIIVTNLEYPKNVPNSSGKLEVIVFPEFISAGGLGAYYEKYDELTFNAIGEVDDMPQHGESRKICRAYSHYDITYCKLLENYEYRYKRMLGFNGSAHELVATTVWDETGKTPLYPGITRNKLSLDAESLLPIPNQVFKGAVANIPSHPFITFDLNSPQSFGAFLMRGFVGVRDHMGTIISKPNMENNASSIQHYIIGSQNELSYIDSYSRKNIITKALLFDDDFKVNMYNVPRMEIKVVDQNFKTTKTFKSCELCSEFKKIEAMGRKVVPVNRTNPAATITSDGKYIYFYGGLGYGYTGSTQPLHYGTDAIGNIRLDLLEYGNSEIGADTKAGPLADLWRLDLQTGIYEYMNIGEQDERDIWACSRENTTYQLCVPHFPAPKLTNNHPPGLIGATMWESDGRIYMFGGSDIVTRDGMPRRGQDARSYHDEIWEFTPSSSGAARGEWKKVDVIPADKSSPSRQSNSLSWIDKNGNPHLFSGTNAIVGDAEIYEAKSRQKPLWEHWMLSKYQLEPGDKTEVSMSVAPERSINPVWDGFDTLQSIPFGRFGLREINIMLSGFPISAQGYTLEFRNPPLGFSIDSTRSTCRALGQPDQDAYIKNWLPQGGNNYKCSFVLKYQPQYNDVDAGVVSVDLMSPEHEPIQTIDVSYSPRW